MTKQHVIQSIKKKWLVKQFLVKMVCGFHLKLGFWKDILFLKINKKAVFPAALCVSSYFRCDQAWLSLDTSLLLDVKHRFSYSVEKRCLQRVSYLYFIKPREARLCVLTNERLFCLDKSLQVFATKAHCPRNKVRTPLSAWFLPMNWTEINNILKSQLDYCSRQSENLSFYV